MKTSRKWIFRKKIINHPKNNNKRIENIKSHINHIFTFEPSVFWDDPEEADVVHMYIIAVVFILRYLWAKKINISTYHYIFDNFCETCAKG